MTHPRYGALVVALLSVVCVPSQILSASEGEATDTARIVESAGEDTRNAQRLLNETQSSLNELRASLVEENEDSERIDRLKFGVGLGWRWIQGQKIDKGIDARIESQDSTLSISVGGQHRFVVSGRMMAFPFAQSQGTRWSWHNLGFVASLDLLDLGKSVGNEKTMLEGGGIGLAYEFENSVWISITLEKLNSRTPRDHLLKRGGQKVSSPIRKDNNQFIDGRFNTLVLAVVLNHRN